MQEAHAISPAPPLSERLTWKQICERYPDQWVAIVEMDWDEDRGKLISGRVAGFGTTRREPIDQMKRAGLHYRSLANRYTGKIRALDFSFGLSPR